MAIDRSLSLLVKFAALDRLTGPMKNIGAGSRAAGKSIGEVRQELASLERNQARIGKMKALETRLKTDSAALGEARAKMEALRLELASTEAPTKKLTNAFAAAERQVGRLETRTDEQGREMQDLSTKLGAAGIDVAQLGRAEDRLSLDIQGATRRLKEQQAELAKTAAAKAKFEKGRALGEQVRGTGYGMVGAGAAIGAPLAATVDPYRDYQSGLTDIAQKADLTRAQAERLGATLLELGPKVAQLPESLRAGVDDLMGKGLDPRRAMALIAPIGRTATAYKAEISDLSSAAYAGLDNLKVGAGEAARMFDVMAVAGKAGSFEMKDMATYFPMLTASAQALGQQGVPAVADLAAALQIARKGAGDASTAANNLQNLLNKINTKDTADNFKGFGIDLAKELKAAEKAGKSPIEAIAELSNRALKGDMSKLSYLFGDAQVQAALRPLVGNLALYRKIRADALAAQGTVERDFANRMGDDASRSNRSAASLERLTNIIGARTSPKMAALKEQVAGLADRFSDWATRNPLLSDGLITVVGCIALVAIGCGIAAVLAGTAATAFAYMGVVCGVLGTGLTIAANAFRFLTAAMMMNPILALAIGIGVAVYLIWAHWDKIKSVFTRGVQWIRSLDFGTIGRNLLQGLINGLNPMTIVRHILTLGGKAITALKGILGIKSPSRVFAGIGGFITEGLAIGIDRGAPSPISRARGLARSVAAAGAISAAPIMAASPGLTAATIPRLAPGAGQAAAPAAAGNTYHLHLEVSPGAEKDPETFAREIMAAMRRLERSEARSSYRDGD